MRTMYDSVDAGAIRADAAMVAGYVDGIFKWLPNGWARFPNAIHVPIAVFPDTNDGIVGDVESGDMTPATCVGWVVRRRAVGIDPTIYMSLSNWGNVRSAFRNAQVAEPWYWVADYDNIPVLFNGSIAKQYANSRLTGGNYDASIVADYWPGIDKPGSVPSRIGGSSSMGMIAFAARPAGISGTGDPAVDRARVTRTGVDWRGDSPYWTPGQWGSIWTGQARDVGLGWFSQDGVHTLMFQILDIGGTMFTNVLHAGDPAKGGWQLGSWQSDTGGLVPAALIDLSASGGVAFVPHTHTTDKGSV